MSRYFKDHLPADGTLHALPCGATGEWDGCGWRCHECMAIYGSIACGCSSDERVQQDTMRPQAESA